MKPILILIAFVAASLFSCKTETLTCETARVRIYFLHFQPEQCQDSYVLYYAKGSGFATVADSQRLSLCDLASSSDTMETMNTYTCDYDYKFVLPSLQLEYKISDITPGPNYKKTIRTGIGNMVKYGCVNNTTSYTLNGKRYGDPAVSSGNYEIVYLTK